MQQPGAIQFRSTWFWSIPWSKTKMLKITKTINKHTLIKQLIIHNKLLKDVYKIVTVQNLSILENKF